jgi:hypothetical protein
MRCILEKEYGSVEIIRLAQDKDKSLSAVSTVMSLQLPQDAGHILISRGSICFSIRAGLCGVGQSLTSAAPYPRTTETQMYRCENLTRQAMYV